MKLFPTRHEVFLEAEKEFTPDIGEISESTEMFGGDYSPIQYHGVFPIYVFAVKYVDMDRWTCCVYGPSGTFKDGDIHHKPGKYVCWSS